MKPFFTAISFLMAVILLSLCSPKVYASQGNDSNSSSNKKSEIKRDQSGEVEYLRRRRRRRRRRGLSSPMGLSVHAMTFNSTAFDNRTYGIGGTFNYAIENGKRKYKVDFYGGLNLILPAKEEFEAGLYSNTTGERTGNVSATLKQSYYQLAVGTKFYIIGQAASKFGFFGKLGVGYMLAPAAIEMGSYDRELYYSDYEEEKASLHDLFFDLGVGLEADLNFARLYFIVDTSLPPNEKNGEYYASDLDVAGSYKIGLRFPIGR